MFTSGKIVPVDGAELYVAEAGNPTGPAVVLLHGGLGSREDWLPLAALLAPTCRLIALDTRGHGGSTLGDPTLSYERLALDAEHVMAACGLVRPVVVGHSDGGIAAIRIAAARRYELAGIVLLMAQADPPTREELDGIFAKLSPRNWRARFPDGVVRYEALNPHPDFDRLFQTTLDMWRNTGDGNYPGALAERIDCPALVIGGDADPLVPSDITVSLARQIPGAKLGILPFGTHMAMATQPERIAADLLTFIEAASTPSLSAPSGLPS